MAETLAVYDFSQLSDLPPDLCWTNPPPETSLGTEGLKVIAAHSDTSYLAWSKGSVGCAYFMCNRPCSSLAFRHTLSMTHADGKN